MFYRFAEMLRAFLEGKRGGAGASGGRLYNWAVEQAPDKSNDL